MKRFFKKHRKRLIIDFAIVLILALLILDSNCRIVESRYEISSPNLPESFSGYKIVQLSDIHGRMFGREGVRLVEKTAGAKPDIIVITGDLVDENTKDYQELEAFLGRLREVAPVYYVSGNHEWWVGCTEELDEIFACQDVRYLKNEYVFPERDGESIALIGLEDPNGPADMIKPARLLAQLEEERGEGFRLVLAHRNNWRETYPELDADVVFCGHAHGGIVRLPFVGGLLGTEINLFPDDVDGTVEIGRYTLVISRGLGNSIIIPRFLNNPEIVSVILKSE